MHAVVALRGKVLHRQALRLVLASRCRENSGSDLEFWSGQKIALLALGKLLFPSLFADLHTRGRRIKLVVPCRQMLALSENCSYFCS